MITTPTSFREVIDLWPSRVALARDLTNFGGVEKGAPTRDWHSKDTIPDSWFDALLSAAAARGFSEVTYRLLSELKRKQREAAPR